MSESTEHPKSAKPAGLAKLSNLSRSVLGRVALITGAGSGMGRATAHLFADEGVRVAVTDIDQERVDAVVAEIVDAGYEAKGWVLDVANPDEIAVVSTEIVTHFGALDFLINNAGIAQRMDLDDQAYGDTWLRCYEVNLRGQMLLSQACLPFLRDSDCARIVNIASTEALGATRGNSAYSATKHGVVGLTRALATDLGREGISVNCVCPGPINTNMTARIPEEQKVIYAKRRTTLGRYGEAEEVAHGTLNFCLPSSSYMNGVVLPIDGGLTIRNA